MDSPGKANCFPPIKISIVRRRLVLLLLLLQVADTRAVIRYVDANNTTPSAPYTDWSSAAVVIQDAVDVADPGDELVVTNGIYQVGGRAVAGTMTNRVAVTKSITLRSVNGPAVTIIRGFQVTGATNGAGAVRCIYLTNGAVLVGVTLTGGATTTTGDYTLEESGGGILCASVSATVSNCVIQGNSALGGGGGAFSGSFYNCTFTGNTAGSGGAVGFKSILSNCTLNGNEAAFGGGAYDCTLNNCVLAGNSAGEGGGVYHGTLQNCTLTGNSASLSAGGASQSSLNNCILYFNTAPVGPNYEVSSTLNHCCTTPLPASGVGNLNDEPQLANDSHLSVLSPCRGAGNALYAKGTDIDGELWASPPSIGCDEFHEGTALGNLGVSIQLELTNFAVGFNVNLTGIIDGWATASRWEFGDGTIVSNRPYVVHAWTSPGDKLIVLRACNDTYPGGITATGMVHVVAPVHYVALDSPAPLPPYSSWASAATSIQDAVDVAMVPGALILVKDGIYASGTRVIDGAMMNRVAITNPVLVRSLNGPQVTTIQGYPTAGDEAIRCVYLAERTVLDGFTLKSGATGGAGGGLWCAADSSVATNCVLADNFAVEAGGGAFGGTLINCLIVSNYARAGGGTHSATLTNCTLLANSAFSSGGGAVGGSLHGCTLQANSCPPGSGGGVSQASLNLCSLLTNSAGQGGGANACTINNSSFRGNSAGGAGGGAYICTLLNCMFTANSADFQGGATFGGTMINCAFSQNTAQFGGAAYVGFLTNCTLTANSASSYGGGTYSSRLNNCIVYGNSATNSPNYDSTCSLDFCCTTPLPASGTGNIETDPRFIDASAANLRLQSNSPCINTGQNVSVSTATDLDGRQRIVNGTVDVGAYEFQPGISGLFLGWLDQFGLATDGSVDEVDSDLDGLSNHQEWIAGTDPTDSFSSLRILSVTRALTGTTVNWTSVSNRVYTVERASKLRGSSAFGIVGTNIVGGAPNTSFTDTGATSSGPYFYRVNVHQ